MNLMKSPPSTFCAKMEAVILETNKKPQEIQPKLSERLVTVPLEVKKKKKKRVGDPHFIISLCLA